MPVLCTLRCIYVCVQACFMYCTVYITIHVYWMSLFYVLYHGYMPLHLTCLCYAPFVGGRSSSCKQHNIERCLDMRLGEGIMCSYICVPGLYVSKTVMFRIHVPALYMSMFLYCMDYAQLPGIRGCNSSEIHFTHMYPYMFYMYIYISFSCLYPFLWISLSFSCVCLVSCLTPVLLTPYHGFMLSVARGHTGNHWYRSKISMLYTQKARIICRCDSFSVHTTLGTHCCENCQHS